MLELLSILIKTTSGLSFLNLKNAFTRGSLVEHCLKSRPVKMVWHRINSISVSSKPFWRARFWNSLNSLLKSRKFVTSEETPLRPLFDLILRGWEWEQEFLIWLDLWPLLCYRDGQCPLPELKFSVWKNHLTFGSRYNSGSKLHLKFY